MSRKQPTPVLVVIIPNPTQHLQRWLLQMTGMALRAAEFHNDVVPIRRPLRRALAQKWAREEFARTASIDIEHHLLRVGWRTIPLQKRQWDLMAVLAPRLGELVPWADLLEAAWPGSKKSAVPVQRIVFAMRHRLEGTGFTIETTVGKGVTLTSTRHTEVITGQSRITPVD